MLRHIPDLLPALRRRLAQDLDLPRIGLHQAHQQFYQGAFASGVGADEAEKLPGGDGKVDVFQHRRGAIRKTEAADVDGFRLTHRRALAILMVVSLRLLT